ncbi:MAG: hypothetical protein ABUR63_07735 [Verrucomicrobiota bacterium]
MTQRRKTSHVDEGNTCTTDCRILVGTCSTGPLPAGVYEIRHGTTSLMLTVPSTVIAPCGGQGIGG